MLEFEIFTGILALIVSFSLIFYISRKSPGSKKMQEISETIHKGALTFLKKQYEVLGVFIAAVALILYFFIPNGDKIAISFVIGGITSALGGNIGMRIATKANCRTAEAAKESIGSGLKIAFYSGVVMGLTIVGLGILGVSVLYLIFKDPNVIYGFGFGASAIALFARVGGGIYTKAADVGADLVGKVEKGIPEDDPRNPAVIADNVGDNVGDVAGMGADLFESYVNSIISSMVLGLIAFGMKGLILPLTIAAVGIISSIIGVFFVRVGKKGSLTGALNTGVFVSTMLMAVLAFIVVGRQGLSISLFYAILVGLFAGIIIGITTEYYTSSDKKPCNNIRIGKAYFL